MVGLADKLMEILELRKKRLSGQDIKLITESILMAEAYEEAEEEAKKGAITEEVMKEWMLGGEAK